MIQTPEFWIVLVGVWLVFWVIPARFRYGFLALASFSFLTTIAPLSVFALLGWTLLFFYVVPHTTGEERGSSRLLWSLVLAVLGFLAAFKYIVPVFADQAAGDGSLQYVIPLGISYYTFKLIHYAIESSRGKFPDRSLDKFLCYMFLFPIFTAGPIERYDHFLNEQEKVWRRQLAVEGITRIAHGLIKKLVISGIFLVTLRNAVVGTSVDLESLSNLTIVEAWVFVYLAFLISYLDFSAYSDIAIGCSRLFGFRIAENFNFPIFAPSISNFWSRWHMTLVSWIQTYIYLPLVGLTRKPALATFVVFITIGLWHAASLNWLLWGACHAFGVIVNQTWARYKRKKKLKQFNGLWWKACGIFMTFSFASVAYVFAETADLGITGAGLVFARLLGLGA